VIGEVLRRWISSRFPFYICILNAPKVRTVTSRNLVRETTDFEWGRSHERLCDGMGKITVLSIPL